MRKGYRIAGYGALCAAVLLITVLPLALLRTAEFGGADEQARKAIEEAHPAYRPWAQPLWRPPGPEVETLIFSLQAALGAGIVGYAIGYFRGRRGSGENNR